MLTTRTRPASAGPVTLTGPEESFAPPVRDDRATVWTHRHLPSRPDDDRTLVRRAASGDHAAFTVLMRRNTDLLRATALRILRSGTDADDVVQETFIAAWAHLPRLVDGGAVTGWLVTTVRRRSYDRLRSAVQRRRAVLEDGMPASTDRAPAAVAERSALVAAAQRVLDGMAPTQRRCWELRHLERRSYDEIAAMLDLPVSTVRGQLARARVVVERELAPWR